MPQLSSDEYELLTQYVVQTLAADAPVQTVRLERDVRMVGRSTTNQIDVVWSFRDGERQRTVLFECRSYGRRLTQQAVFAWRGVVQDVSAIHGDCEGVMCTPVGYQSGAQNVANTYGIVVLELRQPTDLDFKGRIEAVRMTISMRMPFARDIQVDAVEIFHDDESGLLGGLLGDFRVDYVDGRSTALADLFFSGELSSFDENPREEREVERTFDPPAVLVFEGNPQLSMRSIRAIVGEEVGDPQIVTAGGRDELAWMLKDTLGGTRAWFTTDGRYYVTD